MNDEQIDDLKQVIATTVSQAVSYAVSETEARLTGRIDSLDSRMNTFEDRMSTFERKLDDLHQEMAEGFAGVGEATEHIHDRLDDHDQQIAKLQQSIATA